MIVINYYHFKLKRVNFRNQIFIFNLRLLAFNLIREQKKGQLRLNSNSGNKLGPFYQVYWTKDDPRLYAKVPKQSLSGKKM